MLERDESLGQLIDLLARCAEGGGATGIISGPVGVGKTTLLEAVAERASALGYTVLAAVCSPDESAFPYAMVEQLFHGIDRPGTDASLWLSLDRTAEAYEPELGANTAQLMQACHRLLAEVSADRPVVICVDDVQHADPQSLACLLHLIRRCRRIPVAILLTLGMPGATSCVLAELTCRPGVLHARLGALSIEGVTRLVADRFGPGVAERCASAFFDLGGGNPLLTQALLSDHAAAEADPDTACRPVPGDMFREASVACTRRSGPDGLRVARAIAIADGAGSEALLAQLAGLEERVVRSAVKVLVESQLLTGLRLRHAEIRAAVLDDMPAAQQACLHRRAAGLLRGDGAPALVVARHLVESGTADEDWAPQLLLYAADQALAEDSVSLAVQCLKLADGCCDSPGQSHAIKATLAEIMRRDRPEAAARMLLSLVGPAKAGQLPYAISLNVVRRLLVHGRVADAVAIGEPLFDAHDGAGEEAGLDLELDMARLWLAFTYPNVSKELEADLAPPSSYHHTSLRQNGRLRLSTHHALWAALKRGADDAVAAEAEQALERLPIEGDTIDSVNAAIMALVYADRYETAAAWCDRALAAADKRRATAWNAYFSATRALIALRQGELQRAAELADCALQGMSEEAWGVEIGIPLATAIEARTAIGDHAAGAELVNMAVPEALFETRFGVHYLYARGRHYLATGYDEAALVDFTLCGEKARAWELDSPVLAPWRIGMVEVWLRRGQRERAARMADEHLVLAKRVRRRTQGVALRVQATTRPPSQRLDLLGNSLEMLQSVGDRYQVALTLVELCRAHQRQGAASQARLIVRQAWRTAKECGAEELCSSLMPKSAEVPPAESRSLPPTDDKAARLLSEAELRVTALAAQGYTNREISNKLFVTVSTVEQHLTRVYRKLNIRHRRELPASLAS
jgi:DNA-binding CsgD family transcriptional regulator/tetratricopeptide (TPR) repeat protein/ABC-type transporter Mla MlaB component